MKADFDLQSDHETLLARCARMLAPGGEILFTVNQRAFVLEKQRLRGLLVEETAALRPAGRPAFMSL